MLCSMAQVPAALGYQLTAHSPMSSAFVVPRAIGNVWEPYPGCTFAVTCCQECQPYCPSQSCSPSPWDSTAMLTVEQPGDTLCQNWDCFWQVSLQLGEILDLAPETVVSVLMQAQGMSRIWYQDPFGYLLIPFWYLQQFRTRDAGASNELFVCRMVALFFFPAPIFRYQESLSASLLQAFWVNSSSFALVNFLLFLLTII